MEIVGGNGVRLTVPLGRYRGSRVNIYGRITMSADAKTVHVFEESPSGQLVFTRFLALSPGSYRFNLVVKDVTTGTLTSDTIPFDVK